MKKILFPFLFVLSFTTLSCGASQGASTHSDSALTENAAVLPQNSSEKEILQKVPSVKQGKSIKLGHTTVLVSNSYYAASGRECKTLDITDSAQTVSVHKTVCNFDGTWGYTPDVFPKTAGQ